MSFVYYIPGARQNAVKEQAKPLLAHVLEFEEDEKTDSDVQIFTNETGSGPDDGQGGLLHQGKGVPYDRENQKWTKHPNEPYWVGFNEANPPGPADLVRKDPIFMYEMPLGDGNKWKIPTAIGRERDWCPLPEKREIDLETGKIQSRPLKRFDQLRLYADEVRKSVLDQNQDSIHVEREAEIVMESVRTNYRITILEATLLELLTDTACCYVLWALINYFQWPEVQDEMSAVQEEVNS